jgi:hypothetical protein
MTSVLAAAEAVSMTSFWRAPDVALGQVTIEAALPLMRCWSLLA